MSSEAVELDEISPDDEMRLVEIYENFEIYEQYDDSMVGDFSSGDETEYLPENDDLVSEHNYQNLSSINEESAVDFDGSVSIFASKIACIRPDKYNELFLIVKQTIPSTSKAKKKTSVSKKRGRPKKNRLSGLSNSSDSNPCENEFTDIQVDPTSAEYRSLEWSENHLRMDRSDLKFRGKTTLPKAIQALKTPMDHFRFFFDDEIIEWIVMQSNLYSVQKQNDASKSLEVAAIVFYHSLNF